MNEVSPMQPLAVDVREAGRLLSVSPFTIRRMLRDGRLQPIHVGRRVLVPLESLTALVHAKAAAQETCASEDHGSIQAPPLERR